MPPNLQTHVMRQTTRATLLAILLGSYVPVAAVHAQLSDRPRWSVELDHAVRVVPNITYLTVNNWEAKLDVYAPRDTSRAVPTVIVIHGGGWVAGTKEASAMSALPYLARGWAVVNVEYRLAKVSLAPAAVEDCRCALKWVVAHARQYHFDTTRIVVTGGSAGGHLALTTGMLPPSSDLDRQCPYGPPGRVAAIVNWFGITDVNDLLDGPNMRQYAVAWLGSAVDRAAIARRVSPLTYVRRDLPPIITIHGDADPTVPYTHATRLQQALNGAGVANQLVTIPGGKHGGFPRDEQVRAFAAIFAFLDAHGVSASGSR
ncbi:MAG: hypothetical protein NVS1B4_25290 [Gemmatimonadaceae bacterium]